MSQDKIDFQTTPYEFLLVTDKELIEQKFESTIKEFTEYFQKDSWEDIRHHIVKMYVLKIDGEIMGYVTLANAHIRHAKWGFSKSKGWIFGYKLHMSCSVGELIVLVL